MGKLFKYFTKLDFLMIIVLCGFVVLQVICDLALPDHMGDIINLITARAATKSILRIGLKMLLLTAASVCSAIVIRYLAALATANFAKSLRKGFFNKINSFSLEELNQFSVASLITRTTNDISQVQGYIAMFLRIGFSAPIIAVFALLKIINKSYTLSWVMAAAVFVVLILILFLTFVVYPKFKVIQKDTDKINAVMREALTGIRVIRANNAENIIEQKFEQTNQKLTKENLFVNKGFSFFMPSMNLIINALSLVIVWVGSYLMADGSISLADISVFTQYSMQVLMNFLNFSITLTMLPRSLVSTRRINEVLSTKNKIISGELDDILNEGAATIEFKDVCFKYPDSQNCTIQDINFVAKGGEVVAFIGSTGSGKSTIVNLIPRFYDVTQGQILINGIDIRKFKQEYLNSLIGYVPQKSTLFSGMVEENIKYGKPDATAEEIQQALDISQASNFVNKLKGGTNFKLAQAGKNVSGGQKQRLQIARAIIKKPKIYIFDDSFSALDYKTDKMLRSRLKKQTQNAIVLIVAQRIGTIIDADKIIVLDKGRIVGMGKHSALIKNCKIYKEIAYSQLSKKELE